ncbi:MAG: type II toxin-antitoxin system RelE/ParE family toxin [Rhodospirillaceae bacterium]|nr:type II toxin-antitoxin system RelE/ParE family toxin [Rhodospirillaceae bacterium]
MTIVTVVETLEFERRARAIMGDEERMELIDFVARNPMSGVSIGGGVRKFRFARSGRGKSGGYRVVHVYNAEDGGPVILITVFAKNEKTNMSRSETEAVRALGKALNRSFKRTQ